jgi:hypothetical protein
MGYSSSRGWFKWGYEATPPLTKTIPSVLENAYELKALTNKKIKEAEEKRRKTILEDINATARCGHFSYIVYPGSAYLGSNEITEDDVSWLKSKGFQVTKKSEKPTIYTNTIVSNGSYYGGSGGMQYCNSSPPASREIDYTTYTITWGP